MELLTARHLANELLEQYGLKAKGWRFAFDESKSRFGSCHYRIKVIFVSRIFCLVITDEKLRDTLLHEIAHALCPGEHHNEVWRRKAISMGCNGERCGDITKEAASALLLQKFKKAIHNYQLTCPECENISYCKKEMRNCMCGICYSKGLRVLLKLKKL